MSPIPPQYAQQIEVFHVNPSHYSPIPVNMDTGDLLGDMFFDVRSMALPLECANKSDPHAAHDCDNEEVVATDLAVTKLMLEVDSRYGSYGRCNICVNGTDHHGNNSCTDGVYWCSCGEWGEKAKQCGPAVGYEDISDHFGGRGCKAGSKNWECWHDATAVKTGGAWYSTDSVGYCGDGTAPSPTGCTWRVVNVVKRIAKNCSDNLIWSEVEKVDAAGAGCFSTCTDSGVGARRNTTSPCWISCFYDTVLGPDAGTPGGAVAGMPLEDLVAAWQRGFGGVDEGGCAPMPTAASAVPAVPFGKRWGFGTFA